MDDLGYICSRWVTKQSSSSMHNPWMKIIAFQGKIFQFASMKRESADMLLDNIHSFNKTKDASYECCISSGTCQHCLHSHSF
jgi:hypothetical protein